MYVVGCRITIRWNIFEYIRVLRILSRVENPDACVCVPVVLWLVTEGC